MYQQPELNDVCRRLDDLAALVASGRHAGLAERVAESLGPCRAALESLAGQAGAGDAPANSREGCLAIQRRIAHLRAMLNHAEQVRVGLTGVVGLLYEGNTGSRYSPTGEPRLAAPPRILAEA